MMKPSKSNMTDNKDLVDNENMTDNKESVDNENMTDQRPVSKNQQKRLLKLQKRKELQPEWRKKMRQKKK